MLYRLEGAYRMRSRLLVAVIGVPVLLWAVLWAPPFAMMVALMLLAGIGTTELQQCVSGEKRNELNGMSAVIAVFTVDWYFERPDYVALLFVLYALLIFGYAVCKGGEVQFDRLMAALFGSIAIGWSFSAFLRMEAAGVSRLLLLLPFVFSFGSDTCAYFAGRAFGRHKLASKVSPNKTVEGAVGGLLGSVLGGLLFIWGMSRFSEGLAIGYGFMTLMALFCGAVAQLGDLSFSLIKREFGVKGYGRIFLEHGGVLDRFDSVLFVAPVVELILKYLTLQSV